ncbi:MAG: hypothetical protein JWN48_4668 [Myxococcaceae bacterium]|nr:hypothetical protein [Myxococcaceae bacterium]
MARRGGALFAFAEGPVYLWPQCEPCCESAHREGEHSVKFAALVVVLGSLVVADGALAQDAVYAAPARENGPVQHGGGSTLKDSSEHLRPMTASALAYVPWFHGFGIGLKLGFEIPIVPQGFISKLNDSISLEPAFSIARTNYYAYDDVHTTNYVIALGGLWSFWLKENLRVYGAVNLGANIYQYHWDHNRNVHGDNNVDPYVELAGGVFWKFQERWALRGELGWYGPRGGIALLL